MGPETSLKNF